jgi:hypothetical protein
MTPYAEQAQVLFNRIRSEDYYVGRFDALLSSKNYVVDELLKLEDSVICGFLNDFWAALPDSPSIHRVPFYELCTLCEGTDSDEFDSEWEGDEDDIPF